LPKGNRIRLTVWQQQHQFIFRCGKLKNYVKNAFDSEMHIQTAHPKRKCNRPLKEIVNATALATDAVK
jgi:hypothetical protein